MYYAKRMDNENYYVKSDSSFDGSVFMDDDLFTEDEIGHTVLKSFLENPDESYLKEVGQFKTDQEMYKCKKYLNDTDYVITKLNELKVEDDDEYEEAKTKYVDILAKRKECRKRINELEESSISRSEQKIIIDPQD